MDIKYIQTDERNTEWILDPVRLLLISKPLGTVFVDPRGAGYEGKLESEEATILAVDEDMGLHELDEWVKTTYEARDQSGQLRDFPRDRMVLALNDAVLTHDSGNKIWFNKEKTGMWTAKAEFKGAIARMDEAESVDELFKAFDSEMAQRKAVQDAGKAKRYGAQPQVPSNAQNLFSAAQQRIAERRASQLGVAKTPAEASTP